LELNLASVLDGRTINDFSFSLLNDQVQEGLAKVVVDAAVTDDLVAEEGEAEVVDVLAGVLLNVHPVHIHLLTTIFLSSLLTLG
jgi:hypothetical protein